MPTFFLITSVDDYVYYNDKDYFYWEMWQVNSTYPDGHVIDTILCADLINSWTDLSEGERDSLLEEIIYPEYMLCPNTESIYVEGAGYEPNSTYFNLAVWAWEDTPSEIIGETVMVRTDVSRYFNAKQYEENGYEGAITLN